MNKTSYILSRIRRDIIQTLIDKITTHTPCAGAQGSTMTTKYINMQDKTFDSSWFVN